MALNRAVRFESHVHHIRSAGQQGFEPETGVKVIGMKIRIAFEPLGENGPYFLSAVTEDVEARVFGFMKVAETEAISVSDYVLVGK